MKNRLFTLATSVCLGTVVPIASAHSGSALSPQTQIAGYTFGQKSVATAPYTLKDLESLKKTLLFTDEDVLYLRKSKEILANQTDAILDVWYGFVASTPELVEYFKNTKTGQPDSDYLSAVRNDLASGYLIRLMRTMIKLGSIINMRLVFVTPRSKKTKRITLKACLK